MLEVKEVQKRYGTFELECSLTILDGQITGLIGQNGAGKSTLFKAILDLITLDSGSIQVFGQEHHKLSGKEKEKLGVVLSDSGFSAYLTVRDIITILKNMYSNFDLSYFQKQMQRFQLPYDQKIKEFSTGMKAKLKVLIALSHHAQLLILDEPTAGLDVIARDEILDLLRDYMEDEKDASILISSHIAEDLESLCDDLYMIHEGKMIFHEDTDVLLSDYAILKMSEEQFKKLDTQYILKACKEAYGYACLTNQKQYYMENEPGITIEKGTIDAVITMMIRGYSL